MLRALPLALLPLLLAPGLAASSPWVGTGSSTYTSSAHAAHYCGDNTITAALVPTPAGYDLLLMEGPPSQTSHCMVPLAGHWSLDASHGSPETGFSVEREVSTNGALQPYLEILTVAAVGEATAVHWEQRHAGRALWIEGVVDFTAGLSRPA